MAAPQASSRLELLQARFQQKQLQEKEQKLLQLYDQQQQRAYQVVQRGSPGSNGSSYGSSVSQHTVTKTSTSSHTTSTSQGGKVRQMFDERRQTTVKGIDRSYPLEPLENKPRKQTNGNVQKNGNSSMNRHSVTVKRVARADVNSNLNAGKPIVSYHEEITRESFGPSSGRRQPDDDEFGNENHVSQYANGNHRNEIQIEEVLDEDTIERNRMMAKLHLMEYDETLKHRIKNDLESEEFPEDFVEDGPEKLPKQNISKKLSQAEARLERFRNANAKRISNATKNTSSSQVPKKRAETVLPGKVASSKGKTRNASERFEEMQSSSGSERTAKRRNYYEESDRSGTRGIDSKGQFARLLSDSSRNARFRSRSPRLFSQQSEDAATTYQVDPKISEGAKAARTPDFSPDGSRSGSPRFFCKESEKSATSFAIDAKSIAKSDCLKDRRSRRGSPKFFCRESEKTATTYAIDSKPELGSKTSGRPSPDYLNDRSGSPRFFGKESEKSAKTYAIDAKTGLSSKTTRRSSHDFREDARSPSGRFFGKDSEKSAKNYGIDSKGMARSSPDYLKDRRSRSGSPRFFCQESEKSATTYAIDTKTGLGSKTARRLSPDFSSDRSRSGSPRFFGKDSEKSAKNYGIDSKGMARSSPDYLKDRRSRSGSPRFFGKDSEESATTYAIATKTGLGSKTARRLSPDFSSDRSRSGSTTFIGKDSEESATTYAIATKTGLGSKTARRLSPDFSSDRSRSGSPRFFGKDSEKSAKNYGIDSKGMARSSPDYLKDRRSRSGSPRFFGKDSEESATTYAIATKTGLGSKTARRLSPDFSSDRSRSGSTTFIGKDSEESATTYAIATKTGLGSKTARRLSPDFSSDRSRSGSPRFFGKDSEKSAKNYGIDSKGMARSSPDYLKHRRSRSGSPRFFGKDSEESATTYAIATKTGLGSKTARRLSPDFSSDRSRSGSPRFFGKDSEKSAKNYGIDSKGMARSSPDYLKDRRSRSGSPRFFGKDSEESATTYAIATKTGLGSKTARRLSPDFSSERSRSGSPRFFGKDSEKSAKNYGIDSKGMARSSPDYLKDRRSRSGSPRFFGKDSEESATTYAIATKTGLGSKTARRWSPDFSSDRSRSGSPRFFCKESDESATTYAIDSKSKKKLASDLTKNRSIVKIEPDSELIDQSSRRSPVTTDDTVDRYIKDHDLDKVRTPSPTGSPKLYTGQVKIDGKIDSKSVRSESTNIFETFTRDRSSSPQFLHNQSRKSSPVSTTSTKSRESISKSPDKFHNILKNRDRAKISSRKYDFSYPRTATSTSPDFTKTLRKSNASPQFFSDRSATIMFVTPETITKTGTAGYSKQVKKARSPTPSVSKADVTNRIVDSNRRKSIEGIDDSSKQKIRSSVSRYFSEQCEKAARNEEARAKNSAQKSQGPRNADAYRVSSPVSLKHMEAVSPVKSPQHLRESPEKFVATNVNRSRSTTPEFFCYESGEKATTVSLKPRPGPEPVRSESRLSKSSDTFASIKNVHDSSRSSSPLGTQYMTDKDTRILRIFPSKSEQPNCLRHPKSPKSTNKFTSSKGKSSKTSDVFNVDKRARSVSSNRRTSASPEFFCYETDKMATTVSLKPGPSADLREHDKSPEPLRSDSRLSKSSVLIKNINPSRSSSPDLSQHLTDTGRTTPGLFSSKDDKPRSSKDLLRKHTKSPVSTSTFSKGKSLNSSAVLNINKDTKVGGVNKRSRPSARPEFFCYETDKMATTVSLKPRPSADLREHDKSPEPLRSDSRLSKSSDISIKNISRSSSPDLSQHLTDTGRTTPGLFSSKDDKPRSSKDLLRKHTKSPVSTSAFSKGKSLNSSAVLNINKDTKVGGVNKRSRPSARPEFFCYETDKMATTVSLKPRPSADLREHDKSPEPLRSESRLSKSSDISIKNISRSSSPDLSQHLTDTGRTTPGLFSSKEKSNSSKDVLRKDSKSPSTSTYTKGKSPKSRGDFNLPEDTKSKARSHNVSPSPHRGSRGTDFFCYETEKSATTVSLRSSSKSSRSSGFANSLSKGRSSKSPEQPTKDSQGRRGSGNVLRSTRLVRDILKHQRNRENDCAPWRDSAVSGRKERASSVGAVESKQRSKSGWNGNVVDRATTPTSRRKLPDETSPKSGTSAEMNSEIQVVTVTDQCMTQNRVRVSGTYSKSSKTSSSPSRSDTFTGSLTKQVRSRRPPLDSTIFSSSKRDQRSIESGREMDSCSEKTRRSCGSSESVHLDKKRRTMEDTVCLANADESLRSGMQTTSLSRQPPTLGSIELVRKVMKAGSKAPGKTLKTQEADEQEGTQRRPSNSVVEAVELIYGESSKNYDRTDSVESALRRFDSIDTEADVESVQGTLRESATEKRQTPAESRVESYADDSSTISLKALDQDGNSPGVERESSAARLKRTSGTSVAPRARALKKEEDRRRKKITDQLETTGRVRSLTCRRRLFQDNDLETKSLRKIGSKSEATGLAKIGSGEKNKEPSTGMSDSDLSLSVKQLRSIEDIRRSFGDISSDRDKARAKSAIASNSSRARSGKPRVSSSVACDRVGKVSLAKRSENVGASRGSERFVKSATRFSRMVKSPSLDSTKANEAISRTRRSVLSPSKSPDMVTRRPSTELKAADTRSTKRTTPTKDAEPIGNRKTTTTTTTTRKSTDAVDGATVIENGLHLQDQTVETKYDNEPQTAKKTFVIDYKEQPQTENNEPLPRKLLPKKPSIEKQTPSTPMQANTSNPKSKMTLKAKPTNVASSSSRSSASSKTGSNCTPDLLVPCKICGRSFAQDRVTLHEQICAKTGQKRRKLFDSVMSRVKGTELEKFVKKGCAKKQPEKPQEPKSNWRRKHEDFINAIRSAKQVQAHLAAGGKLSDLPPPPPSDTSDYIQCPHCGRKFNKAAAERHIPKCEHMLHNKPVHSRAPKPRR